ncbi:hypothetical protein FOL47_009345 [Perkinsus chesapeaki]|uniref:Endonuclease/exonuclease/phosphatase domain-containing protein n=1 Tax=Perkinsus chesapeaki TaxID=330153 RepID=A0A7J6L8W1_PERCH|nr:hypothetical protein FOL47_009345 [Perkinsus chesapeaki]
MNHSSPRTVRLVAYNIFGFRRGSPSQLAAYLKSLMPIDILCLNEVSIKDRNTTANKNPDFGNAVITRLPVKSASRIALNGGSSVLWRGDDIQIIRNGVLVDFDKFSVCCTHLDHMKEAERVKQVDGLIMQLRERLCPETPHFIMGDFNELSRRDYSDDEWQNLEKRHESFGWPLECDEVVNKLENGGYTDVLRKCGDLRRTAHTQEEKPLYRIDYAWASRAAIDRVKDGFVHCGENVDDLKSCSDHFAIVVDACL